MEGLSGNELAMAQKAVQIKLAWWREHGNGSDFQKREEAELHSLNKKLDRILNEAFPTDECGEIDDTLSDEPLLIPSPPQDPERG